MIGALLVLSQDRTRTTATTRTKKPRTSQQTHFLVYKFLFCFIEALLRVLGVTQTPRALSNQSFYRSLPVKTTRTRHSRYEMPEHNYYCRHHPHPSLGQCSYLSRRTFLLALPRLSASIPFCCSVGPLLLLLLAPSSQEPSLKGR